MREGSLAAYANEKGREIAIVEAINLCLDLRYRRIERHTFTEQDCFHVLLKIYLTGFYDGGAAITDQLAHAKTAHSL